MILGSWPTAHNACAAARGIWSLCSWRGATTFRTELSTPDAFPMNRGVSCCEDDHSPFLGVYRHFWTTQSHVDIFRMISVLWTNPSTAPEEPGMFGSLYWLPGCLFRQSLMQPRLWPERFLITHGFCGLNHRWPGLNLATTEHAKSCKTQFILFHYS